MKTITPLPTTSTKPVAYAYSRYSTKEQAQGDSERRQKDKAQAWADKNGHELIHLLDPGVSAFHGRNRIIGQFSQFLSAVRARQLGPNPVLIIENLDRMSREVIEEAQSHFLELINAGAVIVSTAAKQWFSAYARLATLSDSPANSHGGPRFWLRDGSQSGENPSVELYREVYL